MAPKSLSENAKANPTALGDPVSLKAETSDTEPTQKSQTKSPTDLDTIAPSPTEGDLSNDSGQGSSKKSLKDIANQDLAEAKKGNRSMLGDPVSLKAETTEKDPVENDGRGQITDNKKRDSKL